MSDFYGTLIESIQDRRKYTKDFLNLKKEEAHVVLITDEAMRSYPFHEVIRNSGTYLGEAVTVSRDFMLYKTNNNSSVFTRAPENNAARGPMRGEMYLVPMHMVCMLDRFYTNGTLYNREPLLVWALDQVIKSKDSLAVGKNPVVKVWAYLGDKKYWDINRSNDVLKISFAVKSAAGRFCLNIEGPRNVG